MKGLLLQKQLRFHRGPGTLPSNPSSPGLMCGSPTPPRTDLPSQDTGWGRGGRGP